MAGAGASAGRLRRLTTQRDSYQENADGRCDARGGQQAEARVGGLEGMKAWGQRLEGGGTKQSETDRATQREDKP